MIRSAFLVFNETLYLSSLDEPEFQLETPVSVLCESLAAKFPTQTKTVLRNRIFTNYEPTAFCLGVVKVVAKRLSTLSVQEFENQIRGAKSIERIEAILPSPAEYALPPTTLKPSEIKSALHQLREQSKGIAVGAILSDAAGSVLSSASNQTELNPLWHAEYLAIKRYLVQTRTKISVNSNFFVSLQPCAMCAGFIHHVSRDLSKTHVHYLENDPGPKAQNSVLVTHSDLWNRAGAPKISARLVELETDTSTPLIFR